MKIKQVNHTVAQFKALGETLDRTCATFTAVQRRCNELADAERQLQARITDATRPVTVAMRKFSKVAELFE